MEKQVIYIVTSYGCNSNASDLWMPTSELFVNYDDAYAYFLKKSPSLEDEDNIAKQYKNDKFTDEGYNIIENRVQIAGYLSGQGNCAKRPKGTIFAKNIIKQAN